MVCRRFPATGHAIPMPRHTVRELGNSGDVYCHLAKQVMVIDDLGNDNIVRVVISFG